MLAAVSITNSGNTYNWVWIIVGIFALIEVAKQVKVWSDKKAVRSDKLDQLLREVKPNGGHTKSLGDTAKRTEESLIETRAELARALESMENIANAFHDHVKKDDAVQEALLIAIRGLSKDEP